jgi:hypothetical protein
MKVTARCIKGTGADDGRIVGGVVDEEKVFFAESKKVDDGEGDLCK